MNHEPAVLDTDTLSELSRGIFTSASERWRTWLISGG